MTKIHVDRYRSGGLPPEGEFSLTLQEPLCLNSFFNQRASLVNDVIEGTIIASPWNNLARLESDPAIRVVVRRDLNKNNVAVISGGGAGHEPAHVGFIGKGMLTAAVCGDLFASPSVDAVLTAIQAVTGEAGCLLIVKNYTGDRLNFGLAAEKARRLGYNVEMLIVGDDISLPDNKHPRGIAGTILVHKVAGYFAERGFNLATVLREAQYAASHTASIGVALASCHLPQEAESAPRHQAGHAELGMGIHGEPGASTIATHNSAEIVNLMVEKLTAALPETGRLAVMLNNLGGVSVAEMAILTRELANTPLQARIDWLIGPASLVTALDMKGFSLSAIVLEEGIEKRCCRTWKPPAGRSRCSRGQLTSCRPLSPARASTLRPQPTRRWAITSRR